MGQRRDGGYGLPLGDKHCWLQLVTASLHAAEVSGPVPDTGAAPLHRALKQGRDAEDVRHCRDKWQVTGIQG